MTYLILISALMFIAVAMAVRYGYGPIRRWLGEQEDRYDRLLRQKLLLSVEPRMALITAIGGVIVSAAFVYGVTNNGFAALIAAAIAVFIPSVVMKHLEFKRRDHLERQLTDGLATLASGVRAGLNLVQAMQILVQNHRGPIQQEFSQVLREYEMGMDLDQAMRNASNRIGSSLYRLAFTAIEMHRVRGGDSAQSLDRIADSVREIQRLEGKLSSITAQGRSQANMMAAMPLVMLIILYVIVPDQVSLLFTEPIGRIVLAVALVLIFVGHAWIKKIMQVDL